MHPFKATTSQTELDDLQDRLRRTRFVERPSGSDWRSGVPPEFLRRLVARWLEGFDWPAVQGRLNEYPQFTASVRGIDLHFVHLLDPQKPAIVLLHGWPYTFAEMLPLVDALRGDFSVVVPSLPGYGYSQALPAAFTGPAVAALINEMMTEVLGYKRYFTYGEDVGAGVSDWLAASFPDSVAGIIAPHAAFPPPDRKENLTDEESHFFEWLDGVWDGERAYSDEQATKPDTLAAALNDSPAGLAAWIVEKFHAWSDGQLEETFTLDQLLTTAMIYWTTQSIATSFRPYFAAEHDPPVPRIGVPVAVIVQQHERKYPRSIAERTYDDIRSFELLARGGHFTALEASAEVARVIREFVANVSEFASTRDVATSPGTQT
jgi:pimeloyl-ACP methyl ester carboxylesterase